MTHKYHAPGDKPSLDTVRAQIERDYLARDLEALLDTYGTEPLLRALGGVFAERRTLLPTGTDRRLIEAAILLANTAA